MPNSKQQKIAALLADLSVREASCARIYRTGVEALFAESDLGIIRRIWENREAWRTLLAKIKADGVKLPEQ